MGMLSRIIRAIFASDEPKGDARAILSKKAVAAGGRLNWNESIVDLMKLLNLDSSLEARKELAEELGYTGRLDGSADMNNWLHARVMEKVASGEYS